MSGLALAQTRAPLPTTAELLTQGGDSRIALGADFRNKYGCEPEPRPGLLAYASSTASVVSEGAFARASALRDRLSLEVRLDSPSAAYARELRRVRRALLRACGVYDVLGAEVIFAASGTDLHLVAAQLAAGLGPTRAIVVNQDETGSSVPAALSGKHFSDRTALGARVSEGQSIDGALPVDSVVVRLREPDGTARDSRSVDEEVSAHARAAVAAGMRVLLLAVDVSKTGLLAPSPSALLALAAELGPRLEVVVDACQWRLSRTTLRAYLSSDFTVALTGSKFLTGPAFSGALLVPPGRARRLRHQRMPRSLLSYCARGDWPRGAHPADDLRETPNFGLLLRWEAALHELESISSWSDEDLDTFFGAFGRAATEAFATHPRLEAITPLALDRSALAPPTWDRHPTIFPFLLRRDGGEYLTQQETTRVHRALLAEGIALGQPTPIGARGGTPVSALRLCASARLVADRTTAIEGLKRALAAAARQTGD